MYVYYEPRSQCDVWDTCSIGVVQFVVISWCSYCSSLSGGRPAGEGVHQEQDGSAHCSYVRTRLSYEGATSTHEMCVLSDIMMCYASRHMCCAAGFFEGKHEQGMGDAECIYYSC